MPQPNSKKRKSSHDEPNGDVYTAKPTALFTPTGGRKHTLSIAIPGSIVANTPSVEQKSHLVGAIARALAVFCVDEVIVFEDQEDNNNNGDGGNRSSNGFTAYSDPSHFLAHVLSYLETPPYLRKHLFPMHPNLRTAGTMPSLDMPHHLRQNEWCEYREGVVTSSGHGDDNNNAGTVVDTGLPQKAVLRNVQLPARTRATVHFPDPQNQNAEPRSVDRSTPRKETGYYWGYQVRRCNSLSSVFTECPFDGGYDLSFGTSERGIPLTNIFNSSENPEPEPGNGGDNDDNNNTRTVKPPPTPDYRHLLIVFGGVAGLETAVRNDRQLRDMGLRPVDAEQLFDYWVNLLPGQGSRTIRTEEAVWLGLAGSRPLVESRNRRLQSQRPLRQNEVVQGDVEGGSGSGPVQGNGDANGHGRGDGDEDGHKKKKKKKKEKRSVAP